MKNKKLALCMVEGYNDVVASTLSKVMDRPTDTLSAIMFNPDGTLDLNNRIQDVSGYNVYFVVVGMHPYSASGRDPGDPPSWRSYDFIVKVNTTSPSEQYTIDGFYRWPKAKGVTSITKGPFATLKSVVKAIESLYAGIRESKE